MKNLLINRALAAKKKKIFTFFLALVAGVGTMFAGRVKIGDLYYKLESSHTTAKVTYKSVSSSVYNSDWYITTANIPDSVTYEGKKYTVGIIGGHAFRNTGLTSVTIPNSVKNIDPYAFYQCSELTSVTIPNSVTSSIGAYAFFGCTGLSSVTIGNSVTSIGDYAFHSCTGLTSVTIGNSVTSIGYMAFYKCRGLTSVTIPNSVTSIGAYAFAGCTGLTSVTIEAETPPVLPISVFSGTNNCLIYVPCNAVNAYKAAWSKYADRIRGNCASYAITFKNWDGSILQSTQVEKGEIPQYTGATPTRPDDSQYTYTFSGWTPQIVAATADATYTATFAATKTPPQPTYYTIKFKNWDGSVLQSTQVEKGKMPQYTGTTPTKPSDSQYSYTFSGWTPQIVAATADATYTATFAATKTPPQPTYYTIKFKNWDGSVLQSTQVEKGKMPQYTGTTPTKPSDSQYSYTFSGWTPQIVAATADATYTATFTATEIPSEECADVNDTWLQTGGSGLGEITTDNSGVWKYEYQYGACAKANSGETGWLLTPAKDLRGMKSVNLSFLHVHKKAGTFTDEMTLWVCANYKGSVGASQWQQLTITPYSTNNNWVFVNVSIDVPLNLVGANTVFGFKYISSNGSAKWEIKELNLNAECAKADETTTTDVTATPNEDNSVTLTWPAVNGADTYTIEIKKNGVLVCTLVFNANGQLISINFAAPARDGKGRNVPAAEHSANGWTYIVTGLEGNTSYTYSVTAKDVNGNVLLKQSVDFSTGVAQGIEDVLSDQVQCTKVMRNGQVFILRGDKTYTLTGQETIMP